MTPKPYPVIPRPSYNFGGTVNVAVTRSESQAGLTRQVLEFPTLQKQFTVRWKLTGAEFDILQAWFNTDLESGTLYWVLPVPFGAVIPVDDTSGEPVRFIQSSFRAEYQDFDTWAVSATVERYIEQTTTDPNPQPVPVWYQPQVAVTENIEIDASAEDKLFVVTPTGGETLVILQDEDVDLTEQVIGIRLAATGAVTISNVGTNEAPISKTILVEGFENADIPGDASTTDPNGDTLTYAAGSMDPTNGTLVSVDSSTGAFVYEADPFFTGYDQFTITATDTGGLTGTITVIVIIQDAPESWQDIAKNYFGAWGVYVPGAVGGVTLDGASKVEWLNDFSGNGHDLQDTNVATVRRATLATVGGKQYLRAFHNGSNNGQCFNGSHASFGTPAFDTWAIGLVARGNTAGSANGTGSMVGVSSTTSTTAAISKNESGNWSFGFNGSLSGSITSPNPHTSGQPVRVGMQVLEDNVRSQATVDGKVYTMLFGTSAPLTALNLGTSPNSKVTFSNYDFAALVILDPTGVALLDTSEGRARWDEMMDKMVADFA